MGAATRKDGGRGSSEARPIGGSSQGCALLLAAFALASGGCRAETSPAIGAEPAGTVAFDPTRAPSIAALPKPAAHGASAETGWNATQIDWQPYDAGMARAKAQGKPACVVIYADWCPHCRNYSHVFEDPKVVEKARSFVMIRLNADSDEPAKAYTTDGGYVPRTYFVASDGTVQTDIHAPRPKFMYFYDEHDPGGILAGMDAMLRKAGK